MTPAIVANNEIEFESDEKDIRLVFVVDGSFISKAVPSGISVVFRRFRPASEQHGKQVEMSFPLKDSAALDSGLVEAIGILQAILVALEELAKAGPVEATMATVTIFSDCMRVLDDIGMGMVYKGLDTHHIAMNFVIAKIVKASQRLKTYRGLDVMLEIWWLKGHQQHVEFHVMADLLARSARDLAQPEGWTDVYHPVPCAVSAFDQIEADLARIAATTPVRRPKGPAVSVPVPPTAGRQAPAPVPIVAPVLVVAPAPAPAGPTLSAVLGLPPRPLPAGPRRHRRLGGRQAQSRG